jgi:hypothetical protein
LVKSSASSLAIFGLHRVKGKMMCEQETTMIWMLIGLGIFQFVWSSVLIASLGFR